MDCPIHHRPLECPSCRAAAIGAAGGRAKSDKRAAVAKSLTKRSRKKRAKGQKVRRKREKLQRELRAAEALLARHSVTLVDPNNHKLLAPTVKVTRKALAEMYDGPPVGEIVFERPGSAIARPDPLLAGLERLVGKK